MKKLLAFLILSFVTSAAICETFTVWVRRTGNDLYWDSRNEIYIETRGCFVFVYGDDALLTLYGPGNVNNEIRFSTGEKCRVDNVYRPRN